MSQTGRPLRTRLRFPKELPKFVLFGTMSACATLSAGWLLYEAGSSLHLPYWCATATGAAIGMLVNFQLNYTFNFRFRGRPAIQQLMSFFLVSGFGVVLTALLSELNLHLIGSFAGNVIRMGGVSFRTTLIANILAVGMVAVYSFPAHKFVSFNVGLIARLCQVRAVVSQAHEPV